MRADEQINRIIERFQESLGHLYNGTRDNILFILAEELLLFKSLELQFFKLRLTSSLL